MTDRPNWHRIKHVWTCTTSGDVAETIRTEPTGRAFVIHVCRECGATDDDRDTSR